MLEPHRSLGSSGLLKSLEGAGALKVMGLNPAALSFAAGAPLLESTLPWAQSARRLTAELNRRLELEAHAIRKCAPSAQLKRGLLLLFPIIRCRSCRHQSPVSITSVPVQWLHLSSARVFSRSVCVALRSVLEVSDLRKPETPDPDCSFTSGVAGGWKSALLV